MVMNDVSATWRQITKLLEASLVDFNDQTVKKSKCTQNDQFWEIHFLIKRYFLSNYSSFDAELQKEFFETS